ncbi:MAG: tetratricopeptide (TPR) repeat protein [Akkermansiaceae bacterium]
MRQFVFWVGCFFLSAPIFAEEFKVGSVIHPVVAKLPPPQMIEAFAKGQMAISASSDEAAAHVTQGIARLNTSWDFEAYRHFCAAAKLDPDCLMAYWGITMSLAGSQHEFFKQRQLAVERMLDLLEAEEAAKENRWTQLEKGYAQAAGFLLTGGVRAAGETFQAIATNYPVDIQSKLLSLFLQRDGFDDSGRPLVGQRKASEGLQVILEANPENLSVRSFWVSSQSESPLNVPFIREKVLPIARDLAGKHPDYPPFYLMLAHVEGRCGNAAMAIAAASKACQLYQVYMAGEGVTFYDCECWVRAKVYLISLHEMKGEHAQAMIIAEELAVLKIDEKRLFSRGAGLLLWEGRTAGARAVMGRSDEASLQEGQKNLARSSKEQWFQDKSYALQYRDCLGFYLAVRKAILARDLKGAKVVFELFLGKIRVMAEGRGLASKTSTYASWVRAMNTLTMMIPELRGMLAEMEEGAMQRAATTWYQSAMGQQGRPSNLLPPTVDYPMELRLGDFYLSQSQFKKAKEVYREGLALRPNHLQTLKGYHQALVKLGWKEAAAVIEKRMKAVAQQ